MKTVKIVGMGVLLLSAGMILHLLGFSTPVWITSPSQANNRGKSMGLFQMCTTEVCRSFLTDVPDWLYDVQDLTIAATVLLCMSFFSSVFVFLFLFYFLRRAKKTGVFLPIGGIFIATCGVPAGFLDFVAVGVYCNSHDDLTQDGSSTLGFSLYLCIIGGAFSILGSMPISIVLLHEHRKPLPPPSPKSGASHRKSSSPRAGLDRQRRQKQRPPESAEEGNRGASRSKSKPSKTRSRDKKRLHVDTELGQSHSHKQPQQLDTKQEHTEPPYSDYKASKRPPRKKRQPLDTEQEPPYRKYVRRPHRHRQHLEAKQENIEPRYSDFKPSKRRPPKKRQLLDIEEDNEELAHSKPSKSFNLNTTFSSLLRHKSRPSKKLKMDENNRDPFPEYKPYKPRASHWENTKAWNSLRKKNQDLSNQQTNANPAFCLY